MIKLALIGITTLGLGGGYAYTHMQGEQGCPMTETISLVTSSTLAADPATKPTTAPSTGPSDAAVNKLCPVTQEDIDTAIFTLHDGKKIAFCCASCVATFKADPEKYLKDMK